MTVGPRAGNAFPLDPERPNLIGRGPECAVVLGDALCSREHAVLEWRDGQWRARDKDSRNGTFVNGLRIDEATLAPGHILRVGSTEFVFHEDDRADPSEPLDTGFTQTIVMDAPIGDRDTSQISLNVVNDPEQAKELLLLYQFAFDLLGREAPDSILASGLELLQNRTQAAVVGFLEIDDQGRLEPTLVIPRDAALRVNLSRALTRLVTEQGHAVWIANQGPADAAGDKTLSHYADAVCAPLVGGAAALGAIYLYLDRGRFRQSDFDFAISVANILAVALARARRHASLEADQQRLVEKSADAGEPLEGEPTRALETLEIAVWEQKLIREALRRAGGNVPEAAKLLGIGRATLYRKIEQYAIPR
jgi:Nif-specific regulatory protein